MTTEWRGKGWEGWGHLNHLSQQTISSTAWCTFAAGAATAAARPSVLETLAAACSLLTMPPIVCCVVFSLFHPPLPDLPCSHLPYHSGLYSHDIMIMNCYNNRYRFFLPQYNPYLPPRSTQPSGMAKYISNRAESNNGWW